MIFKKHVRLSGIDFLVFGRVPRCARVGVLRATLRFGAALRSALG
ncbi:MAG: hypothetical protein NZ455_10505 [Bacteroidia bacterium]|nr:hypothetical protein [Bacteroidia bacterium]MDW8347358.1 hypothetical protein [Bacteroidia bacterium]